MSGVSAEQLAAVTNEIIAGKSIEDLVTEAEDRLKAVRTIRAAMGKTSNGKPRAKKAVGVPA